MASEGPPHEVYLKSVLAEMRLRAPEFAAKPLVSIYFGGGTPSLWQPEALAQVIATAQDLFPSEGALEISLECNPTDCIDLNFSRWQSAGINRLLVGVQATNQADLLTLGRDHRVGDGQAALDRALAAGFRSVGADVILGVPGSVDPLASLRQVANTKVPHISAYELTFKDKTAFAGMVARGEIRPEPEDTLAELLEATHDYLVGCGYEHYEISSYAQPGHRAVHNSLYWTGADYLGLGNGAASLLTHSDGSARRWQNQRSSSRYMSDPIGHSVETHEEIGPAEFAVEKLWLAMRTSDGVEESHLVGREAVIEAMIGEKLLRRQDGRVAPTRRGFLYNNQVIERLALA